MKLKNFMTLRFMGKRTSRAPKSRGCIVATGPESTPERRVPFLKFYNYELARIVRDLIVNLGVNLASLTLSIHIDFYLGATFMRR